MKQIEYKILQTFLKTYYLDELDVVAFQSNSEDDPVILSNKMRSQMSINGEWRNTADGEGVIFWHCS